MNKRLLSMLALALGSTASAAEPVSSPPPADPAASTRSVTLHDLLVEALNTNLELRAKRIDPAIQENRLTAAWGAFEPNWVASYSFSTSERPQTASVTTSIFGGTGSLYQDQVDHFETGVTGRLPTGTQYQVLTTTDRTRNTYNRAANSPFRPEYVSNSTLTLVQPILRDFGFSSNLAEVRLQKSARTASRYELETTLLRILRDVSAAYFEMVFAQENIRVKEQAVTVAENLVRENQRRADEGRMAPIDITQAKGRLSEAREELLLARNFLAQRRNTLRELTRENFSFDEAEFVVDDAFIRREAPALERDRALATLFEHNPSYLASVEIARSEDIRIAYAKNQLWPRVDLRGTFGFNGLQDDFVDSYKDYYQRDQPTWSAGIVVNVPLGNRTARGRLAEAKNRKLQAVYNLKRTEVVLLSAFDTALRDIANAAERVVLVKDSVALAQAAADAENLRLGQGRTTSFNVSQSLRDLSQAQSRALASLVDLNKALVQLQFVLGTLPEYLRVEVTSE
ncbi:MAG TPA: TolC family protein [Opitutaceae bacterium]